MSTRKSSSLLPAALLAVAAGVCGFYAGAELYGPYVTPKRAVSHVSAWVRHFTLRGDPAYVGAGHGLYETRCAACHGLGDGNAAKVANVAFSQHGDVGVFRRIAHAPALGDMPAFVHDLSDDEIMSVVAYLRAVRDRDATLPPLAGPLPDGRYEYVAQRGGLVVYDIDAGFEAVSTIRSPHMRGVLGVAASIETGLLYVSYRTAHAGIDQRSGDGTLVAIDLASSLPLWSREIRPGVDSFAVTPDGDKIYMPTGEHGKERTDWIVLDARTGEERKRVPFAPAPHNTVISPDGRRAYLAAIGSDHLGVLDTRTDTVVAKIGPFGERLRPLALTSDGRFALVNVNFLSGFEVADLEEGKVLHRVVAEGWPWIDPELPLTQSHGVALSPDEREAWVSDASNVRVQIFDVSALPERPRHLDSVDVRPPGSGDDPVKAGLPKWIRFTRDGRWVHVSNGAIIDARTREVVKWISPSRHYIEVHWQAGKPSAAFSRYGNGYRAAAANRP